MSSARSPGLSHRAFDVVLGVTQTVVNGIVVETEVIGEVRRERGPGTGSSETQEDLRRNLVQHFLDKDGMD